MENPHAAPLSPFFAPGLYLVSTPIGNLRDITLRALDLLAAADIVICEDTRVTGKLLDAYSLKKKMISYNDHSDAHQRAQIIDMLRQGKIVALTSDAGTPLISDPGYKLVRDCLAADIGVTPLPGANALLPALQLSGLPSDAFIFAGFTPSKSEARRKLFGNWAMVPATLIFYETGPRLAASLSDMLAVFGDRPAAVVREITKRFEEGQRGNLSALIALYEDNPPKGEIVVLVAGLDPEAATATPEYIDAQLLAALQTMSVKDAAAFVAASMGLKRKAIYERALALSKEATR